MCTCAQLGYKILVQNAVSLLQVEHSAAEEVVLPSVSITHLYFHHSWLCGLVTL